MMNPSMMNERSTRTLLVITLIALVLIIRVMVLFVMPFHADEGNDMLSKAIEFHGEIFEGQRSSDYWLRFAGLPVIAVDGRAHPFTYVFTSLFVPITSDPVLIVRMPALILGSLGAILLFASALHYMRTSSAFLLSLMVSFLPWHIAYSTSSLRNSAHLFSGPALLALFLLSGRSPSRLFRGLFVASLAFAGLYYHGLGPIFFVVFLPALFLKKNFVSSPWEIPLYTLIFLAFCAPLLFVAQGLGENFGAQPLDQTIFTGTTFTEGIRRFFHSLWEGANSLFFAKKVGSFSSKTMIGPLVGFPGLPLIVAGLVHKVLRGEGRQILLLIWWFIVAIVIGGGLALNPQPRYLLPVMTPLLLLAGIGLQALYDWTKGLNGKVLRYCGYALLSVFLLSYLISGLEYIAREPSTTELMYAHYGSKEAVSSILSDVGEHADNAFIFMDSYRMTSSFYLWSHARKHEMPFVWRGHPPNFGSTAEISVFKQVDETMNGEEIEALLDYAVKKKIPAYAFLWAPDLAKIYTYTDEMKRRTEDLQHLIRSRFHRRTLIKFPDGTPAIEIYQMPAEF